MSTKNTETQNWPTPLKFPYAVVRAGGKQYTVSSGDMILVEKIDANVGDTFTADDILFVAKKSGDTVIGKPNVEGASVQFEVLQKTLNKKIIIRHQRRRQSSQKTLGHRQPQTRLLVKEIKV